MKRRSFLAQSMSAALAAASASQAAVAGQPLHIATNTYPWGTFAKRESRKLAVHSDELLAAIAASGINGYEPAIGKPDEFNGLGARLEAHGLEMRSIYVNSVLHDDAQAKDSIASVLEIARLGAELGVKIVVTNPSPIKWGGLENKTDAQLVTQAAALNQLGAELGRLGVSLAYHNHDIEFRFGGREFHHMLTATEPAAVKFCLDAHWVFRGCGDSQVALFDALELYGERVVELHLRQSHAGKWTEVFAAKGDIDYGRLAGWLKQHRLQPHLVLEQAVEQGSPHTMDAVEAHRRSFENAKLLFGTMG